MDHPALLQRFSDILAEKMVAFNRILRDFSGHDEAGWWITDDNSALFSPRLYATYCAPVLAVVLDDLAPGDAWRYQHSDSAMGHLHRPAACAGYSRRELRSGGGRRHHPRAVCRTPGYAGRCRLSCCATAARRRSKRAWPRILPRQVQAAGLELTTAGSLAAGTGVGRMRWFMLAAQARARYA